MKWGSIIVLCMMVLTAWGQHIDERAGLCLNQSRWFELKEIYSTDSAKMSPLIRRFAKAMIDHMFNRPSEACADIKTLLTNHQQEMGGANVVSMMSMLADNYHRMGDNRTAASMAKKMGDQLEGHADSAMVATFRAKEQMYAALAELPLNQTDGKDYDVAFGLMPMADSAQVLITIDGRLNGRQGRFIFDTGAAYNVITPQLAQQYGVRVVARHFDVQGTRSMRGQMGIADSISLGGMTMRHVLFAILDIDQGNQRARKVTSKIGLILGQETLKSFGRYTINFAQRSIRFEAHSPRQEQASNLYFAPTPMVEVWQDGRRMALTLDSGASRTMLGQAYYKAFAADVARSGKWDIQALTGFGGVTYNSVFLMPRIEMSLGTQPFGLTQVAVTALSTGNGFATGYGRLGMDFLQQWREVSIDNTNMTFKVKP